MVKSHKELKRWYAPLEPGPPQPPVDPPAPILKAIDGGAARPAAAASTSGTAEQQVAGTLEPRVAEAPPEWWLRDRTRADYVGDWYDWVSAGEAARDISTDEEEPPANLLPLPGRSESSTAPSSTAPPPVAETGLPPERRRTAFIIGAVAALIVGMAIAATVFRLMAGPAPKPATQSGPLPPHTADTAAVPVVPAAAPAGPAAGFCPVRNEPQVVQSAGPGGTTSGPDSILRFQHAYYVDRSAAKAWEVVAPGALESREGLQRAIDAVPLGTRHCVQISAAGPDRHKVVVTVLGPDGKPLVYPMTISTNLIGGRALITSIAKA